MSIDLESIINQTFNDEYNRIANIPVGNSEAKNIENVFINIDNIAECLICCDDDKNCIKCFQCTAYYCKGCFIKIASDFNKCSTCGVSIKDNYKKLKEYNQELQEQLQIEKAIANSLNDYDKKNSKKPQKEKENIHIRNDNSNSTNIRGGSVSDSDDTSNDTSNSSDIESEEDIKQSKQKLKYENKSNSNNPKSNNIKTNLKPSLMNILKFKSKDKKDKKNKKDNINNNEINNEENNENNNYNLFNNKKTFIQDLKEDKIYNINFTSYISEIGPNKPNYSYEWKHANKKLIFYALCNQNNDFINIIVNYNILKSTFQLVLYIWLNEIAKMSFNTFKTKWNSIATKINDFSSKDYFVTNQEIKKFTKKIVSICKN
jgi:hypothetical protein